MAITPKIIEYLGYWIGPSNLTGAKTPHPNDEERLDELVDVISQEHGERFNSDENQELWDATRQEWREKIKSPTFAEDDMLEKHKISDILNTIKDRLTEKYPQ